MQVSHSLCQATLWRKSWLTWSNMAPCNVQCSASATKNSMLKRLKSTRSLLQRAAFMWLRWAMAVQLWMQASRKATWLWNSMAQRWKTVVKCKRKWASCVLATKPLSNTIATINSKPLPLLSRTTKAPQASPRAATSLHWAAHSWHWPARRRRISISPTVWRWLDWRTASLKPTASRTAS